MDLKHQALALISDAEKRGFDLLANHLRKLAQCRSNSGEADSYGYITCTKLIDHDGEHSGVGGWGKITTWN